MEKMNVVTERYFEPIYDLITDEIHEALPKQTADKLMKLLERAENRLTIEIEMREFACDKFAKLATTN